jgi:hypothetical protein
MQRMARHSTVTLTLDRYARQAADLDSAVNSMPAAVNQVQTTLVHDGDCGWFPADWEQVEQHAVSRCPVERSLR